MGHMLLSRQIGGCAFISGVKMGVSPAVLEIEARHGLLDLVSSCHTCDETLQKRIKSTDLDATYGRGLYIFLE